MRGWFRGGMASAIGLMLVSAPVWGQVVRERDTKVTGPRGRSVERDLRSIQGPGFIDRQTTITRPGGTFHRDVLIERRPGFGGGGGGGGGGWVGGGPRFYPGRGPVEVIAPGVSPLGAVVAGLGGFGLGLGTGALIGAANSGPPVAPVYVVPAPPPNVVYAPPQPYFPAPPPALTVVVDPVANAIARLQSHHGNSRREGAETLGRLRDPRAVPPLVDRLKNDTDKNVRITAATALGEIGDPSAGIYLERSSVYDKKKEVRDASATSLSRLPRHPPPQGNFSAATPAAATVPSISAAENVPPPPTPAFPDPR